MANKKDWRIRRAGGTETPDSERETDNHRGRLSQRQIDISVSTQRRKCICAAAYLSI